MGPEKGRERRRVFLSDGTAGTQTRGPNWGLGYRVHRAKGRLRICLIPFLCPRGFGCVRAGHVEVAKWGSRLSTHGRLVSPSRRALGQASCFFSQGDGIGLAGIRCVELRGPGSWDLQGLWQTAQACFLGCLQRSSAQDKASASRRWEPLLLTLGGQ